MTAAEKLLDRASPSGAAVPAPLPATGAALADGAIGAGQARLICDTIRRLPPRVDADTRAHAEAFLAGQARDLDTTTLGKLARRMLAHPGPGRGGARRRGRGPGPGTVPEPRLRTG